MKQEIQWKIKIHRPNNARIHVPVTGRVRTIFTISEKVFLQNVLIEKFASQIDVEMTFDCFKIPDRLVRQPNKMTFLEHTISIIIQLCGT